MHAKEAKQLRGDSKSQNEQNVLEISTAVESESDSGPCDSTVNLQEEQPGPSNLKVKMNFNAEDGQKRKAITKLNVAKKRMRILTDTMEKLNRRNSCLRKRLQRLRSQNIRKGAKQNPDRLQQVQQLRPKSKTDAQVNCLNMTPTSKKKVYKQLHFNNCCLDELKSSINITKGKQAQKSLLRVVCGKIMHKDKMERSLGKYMNVNRRQRLGKARKKPKAV